MGQYTEPQIKLTADIIKEIYGYNEPGYEHYSWQEFSEASYMPMIKSFGFDILIQVDDNDYQGDTRILFYDRPTNRYGMLIFGWGSCSGCDALQACGTFVGAAELYLGMLDSIKWFDSAVETLHYVSTRDWELQYAWHVEGTREFITKIMSYLVEQIVSELKDNSKPENDDGSAEEYTTTINAKGEDDKDKTIEALKLRIENKDEVIQELQLHIKDLQEELNRIHEHL